ncbi:unnamed protein product [Blepharisma stoltei]|uniref:Uncharacterized protein n=1 Tax=Blepharisma stoltei TaxID=1481888 RepID=A0AAU9IHS0_9CILI|nr:unnamed protein product [Blepharisma stoltei]
MSSKIPPYVIQEILPELIKPILHCFADSKEKCREIAIEILSSLIGRCVEPDEFLAYIFPVLVERLDAYDIEGIQNLPEVMRPNPSQRPQVVKSPKEPSEELRILLAKFIQVITEKTSVRSLSPYVQELTSVIRILCMDPNNGEVIITSCKTMEFLAAKAKELLFHYSEPLARSLYTAIVHKSWKVRCASLEALRVVMYIGVFKYNATIVEGLIGFRDPNVVPIKDFYEPSAKLNYLAMLINDRSAHVRETFLNVISDWLLNLPDKYDLETRLIPYLLSGLFDPIPGIRENTFAQIEAIGQKYEEEKEKEIREIRQLGFQEPWTCDGIMTYLPLPEPFAKRPRLGARLYFRQYVRRYLNAIFAELGDWIASSRLYSSNLLVCLIIFTEDYITQHLDKFLSCIYKALIMNSNPKVIENLQTAIKLVGRYVNTDSYMPQVLAALMVR